MGKKLNRLLSGFRKPSKLKFTLKLAVTRLLILKNRRKVRCSQSRSDVIQLLHLGHHDTALLRVEQVIKEQNMVDAYAIMENYLNLLIERLGLIEHQKESCPEEVKEGVASLIFASSRCGDFPELQEIRAAFSSLYGKEFVTRCVELRNHCGVNTKMIQKMSTLAPSLETKTKLLNEIASENNILLYLLNNEQSGQSEGGVEPSNFGIGEDDSFDNSSSSSYQSINKTEFTDSFKTRHNKYYKDVADAAQDAFENAAYAAAAARAAVELSRTGGPQQPGPIRPEDQEFRNNFDRAGSFYSSDEVVVLPSKKAMKSMLIVGPDADQDNVPRLNLDRMPISLRAKRVSGY